MTTIQASNTPSTDKRARAKAVITDKPGEFALIDKAQLRIDQNYQRRHKEEKTKRMSAEWSWVACGAISVALRSDAEWFVMDGQHRVLAALMRDDIKNLPCLVFDVDTVADEARGFLATNTQRKPMTMVDRFKALLMTEDHTARVANELILASGRRVGTGSAAGIFAAVYALLDCLRIDEATTRRIWPVVTALCAPDKRIMQHLLAGMCYLEKNLPPGESLTAARWKNRLVQVGYDAVLQAIMQSAAYHGSGKGHRTSALGIVHAINKGLRNHLQHDITTEAANS